MEGRQPGEVSDVHDKDEMKGDYDGDRKPRLLQEGGGSKNSKSLIDVTPLGFCVNLRRWIWSAKEPLAPFVRTFYVQESPFPRSFLCPSEAETSLFPCPPPVDPKDACLKPGGEEVELS